MIEKLPHSPSFHLATVGGLATGHLQGEIGPTTAQHATTKKSRIFENGRITLCITVCLCDFLSNSLSWSLTLFKVEKLYYLACLAVELE
jgi:hypothetical protein